jgi:hypothetical protein
VEAEAFQPSGKGLKKRVSKVSNKVRVFPSTQDRLFVGFLHKSEKYRGEN